MKTQEIRSLDVSGDVGDDAQLLLLREMTAQFSELNQSLREVIESGALETMAEGVAALDVRLCELLELAKPLAASMAKVLAAVSAVSIKAQREPRKPAAGRIRRAR